VKRTTELYRLEYPTEACSVVRYADWALKSIFAPALEVLGYCQSSAARTDLWTPLQAAESSLAAHEAFKLTGILK
jgi:hypothetical protein